MVVYHKTIEIAVSIIGPTSPDCEDYFTDLQKQLNAVANQKKRQARYGVRLTHLSSLLRSQRR